MLYGVLATSPKSVGGAPLEGLKRYIQRTWKAVLEGRGFQPNFSIKQ
jgi:hypothetical protein